MGHTGRCLCAGVRFRITGELQPIQVCHCSQCRRAQGGPVGTNIPVQRSAIQFESGQELLKRFESTPGKSRVFCSVCGSPVFSERTSLPDVIRLRAGLLDEPVASRVGFHAFVESAASWWPVPDDAPHFEGFPPSA